MTLSHKSPLAMVRSLATYMTEPRRIQSAVYAEFGTIPPMREVLHAIESFKRRPVYGHGGRLPEDSKNPAADYSGLGSQRVADAAVRRATDTLRRAIIREHPEIMKRLEADNKCVRWP